jgi:hypothetical protein
MKTKLLLFPQKIARTTNERQTITFDIFIRTKERDGSWGAWQREQMTERMWPIEAVRNIVQKLPGCTLEGIFDDNFLPVTNEEPGLAYVVLKKHKRQSSVSRLTSAAF